ncbi:hypothetical protein GCM10011369_33760 [Neiella marina]|uniref:Uncharacterized protein n=1 Tax=Neiella marina TaxID=508461 RepID=A0A8J2U9M6_9GAMM|nr:hypothetical protein [Neiella marina]GGA88868.1 hypothetical protein GCM10011369_33760 [Neiella marina]
MRIQQNNSLAIDHSSIATSRADTAQLARCPESVAKMVRADNLSSFAISDDELKHRSLSMVIAENIILSLAH